jgi:hypothetical protein
MQASSHLLPGPSPPFRYGIDVLRAHGSTNMLLEAYHWLRAHLPYWWGDGGGGGGARILARVHGQLLQHIVPWHPLQAAAALSTHA